MSWDEKLGAMEDQWQTLRRKNPRLESPPWHQKALLETVAHHDAGMEQPIEWDDAKRELRWQAG